MRAISYRDYASDLHSRIRKLRAARDTSASIVIAICRNAYCYKSIETTGAACTRERSSGPLNGMAALKLDDTDQTSREIDNFFALPEIYAYSEAALAEGRSPLGRAHWDGTVALVEVRYETARTTWHQRMLFIGFSDPIHADFTVGIDDDLFVSSRSNGQQLFEWRSNEPGSEPVHEAEVGRNEVRDNVRRTIVQRLTGLVRTPRSSRLDHRSLLVTTNPIDNPPTPDGNNAATWFRFPQQLAVAPSLPET
ncbi:hypothetical protein [Rhizobium sp. Leaf383]|uniref:hypothetical protein n=1 Tax=Rhizobium sp. Leaf383 TaxID=1736357 RepID=UPI000714BF66|nr:hypothetical protein [Rhizobium sp. Leaf383]KQS76403.1 hypothetical protein ASG58_11300 [Rhizobium sp. Leaf383]